MTVSRATPEIDLRFRGVGRVRVWTGTDARGMTTTLKEMLRQLYRLGRLDVLAALRDKRLTLLQVYAHYRQGELERLPTAEGMAPAQEMLEWVKGIENVETRRSYQYGIAGLLRAAPPNPTVADLPRLLRTYRAACSDRKVMFNRCRMGVRAYLRETLGKRHALALAVADVPAWKEHPIKAAPWTVEEMVRLSQGLVGCEGMAWTLALSGMRRGEYWGVWAVKDGAFRVRGTKTRGAVRPVPFVGYGEKPRIEYAAFRRRLVALAPGHRVHNFRQTFAHWAEAAGISRSRRMMYLGHGAGDVTDLYERHEVEGFLLGDAELLRAWLWAQVPGHVFASGQVPEIAPAATA
jgi:hypothetical protein